jgi:hypothetical protein
MQFDIDFTSILNEPALLTSNISNGFYPVEDIPIG